VSQTFNEVLATLEKGDILKLSATLRVKSRDEVGVITEEVRGGGLWAISPEDGETSAKLEIVSKAAKAAPARQLFRVGDPISGEMLRKVMWKRGTVVIHRGSYRDSAYALRRDGRWQSLDDECTYDFEDFTADKYEILHLPK
jgi:hypothetical protein